MSTAFEQEVGPEVYRQMRKFHAGGTDATMNTLRAATFIQRDIDANPDRDNRAEQSILESMYQGKIVPEKWTTTDIQDIAFQIEDAEAVFGDEPVNDGTDLVYRGAQPTGGSDRHHRRDRGGRIL